MTPSQERPLPCCTYLCRFSNFDDTFGQPPPHSLPSVHSTTTHSQPSGFHWLTWCFFFCLAILTNKVLVFSTLLMRIYLPRLTNISSPKVLFFFFFFQVHFYGVCLKLSPWIILSIPEKSALLPGAKMFSPRWHNPLVLFKMHRIWMKKIGQKSKKKKKIYCGAGPPKWKWTVAPAAIVKAGRGGWENKLGCCWIGMSCWYMGSCCCCCCNCKKRCWNKSVWRCWSIKAYCWVAAMSSGWLTMGGDVTWAWLELSL